MKLNFSTPEGLTFFFFKLMVFEAQEYSNFLKELSIMLRKARLLKTLWYRIDGEVKDENLALNTARNSYF